MSLSKKHQKAIASLISCPTREVAAKAVGVDPRTLYRWLQNPEFLAEYDRQCNALVEDATRELKKNMRAAVSALVEALKAHETKYFQHEGSVTDQRDVVAWGPRHAGAKSILEMLVRYVENGELEKRIERLEQAFEEKKS